MRDQDHEATVNQLTQAKDNALAAAASAERRAEQTLEGRQNVLNEQKHALQTKEAQLTAYKNITMRKTIVFRWFWNLMKKTF